MDQCCSRCSVNVFPDPVDVMEVDMSDLANVIDMRLKAQHRVPGHSEVAHVVLGVTFSPHISSCIGSRDLSTCGVVMMNSSVLLEFILRK